MSSSTNVAAHAAYALQLTLGFVFLAAALPKLRRAALFATTVADYRIVPTRLARATAFALIVTESFLAFAFLSGWLTAVSFPMAAAALIAFSLAVAINVRRGRDVPCGCFGSPQEPISKRSLVRLAALGAALCALVLLTASGGVGTVTLESVLAEGAAGLEYLLQVGGLAGFVTVAGMWALNLPEFVSVLHSRPAGTPEHAELTP